MKSGTSTQKVSYLSFRLGEEIFAVHVFHVLEVLQNKKITQIPNVAGHLKGVINYRGNILPVVDLCEKLHIESATTKKVIIVFDVEIKSKKQTIGAIADSVKDVFFIQNKEIRAIPELNTERYETEFFQGMVKIDDKFIMLLDINEIFKHDEIALIKDDTDTALPENGFDSRVEKKVI